MSSFFFLSIDYNYVTYGMKYWVLTQVSINRIEMSPTKVANNCHAKSENTILLALEYHLNWNADKIYWNTCKIYVKITWKFWL